MDPVLTPMIIGAATKAAGRTTAGLGNVASGLIAARALKMTPEEERELALLQAAEAAGQEALTAEQEALIRQSFLAEQGAMAREQQAGQLQAVAARAAAPATAGREIFLAEQAAQQAGAATTVKRNEALAQAEAVAQAERAQRIAALEGRAQEAKAAQLQAFGAAVGVPLEAVGATAEDFGQLAMSGELPLGEMAPADEFDEEDFWAGFVEGM